jgi:hypothetical protein
MKPQATRTPLDVQCDRYRTNRADYRWVAASMAALRARPGLALCGPGLGAVFTLLANGCAKARQKGKPFADRPGRPDAPKESR